MLEANDSEKIPTNEKNAEYSFASSLTELGHIGIMSTSQKFSIRKAPKKISNEIVSTNLKGIAAYKGTFLALITGFGLASVNVVMKMSKNFSPGDFAFVRYIVLLIFVYAVLKFKKLDILGPREHFKLLCFRGFIGSCSILTFYFASILLSPSDALTIVHMNILLTAFMSRIFLKEKLSIAHLIAIFLTINGIIFIAKPTFIFAKFIPNTEIELATKFTNETAQENETDFITHIKPILGYKLFHLIISQKDHIANKSRSSSLCKFFDNRIVSHCNALSDTIFLLSTIQLKYYSFIFFSK